MIFTGPPEAPSEISFFKQVPVVINMKYNRFSKRKYNFIMEVLLLPSFVETVIRTNTYHFMSISRKLTVYNDTHFDF